MRTVFEEDHVSEKLDAERAIYRRLDDAWRALTWWIARKPDSGVLVDDVYWLYKQQGNHELKIPALVIIYTFDHRGRYTLFTRTFAGLLMQPGREQQRDCSNPIQMKRKVGCECFRSVIPPDSVTFTESS
jgi:hypothetical protein